MAMYNQVFDMYHCIYRIIHILKRLHENEILELDRLRIWDFYILFPYKIHVCPLKIVDGLYKFNN